MCVNDPTLVQQPPYPQLTLGEHPLPPSPLLEIAIKPHITSPQNGNVTPAATLPSGHGFMALPVPEYGSALTLDSNRIDLSPITSSQALWCILSFQPEPRRTVVLQQIQSVVAGAQQRASVLKVK